MKTLIVFLAFTAGIIISGNYYFEYCVNREISEFIYIPATIAIIITIVFYIKYLVNVIIKLLNLKNGNK